MKVKFLDLHKQYLSIQKEIDNATQAVISTSAFVGGRFVSDFERDFSEFLGNGAKTLGVANGTDALEIALECLNLPKGSEVLLPANTFAATAEAVVRNGLKIVFVDCGEDYTLDIKDLKNKITPKSSAIIAVHLYGLPARMDEILALASKHSLKVIEDCAQAHGATYRGQKVGTFGDIATFSFYPGKNLGAYGDGGAIVSQNEELLQTCKKIAHHGGLKKYEHEIVGRNSRLDGLQAAILSVKLKHLSSWNKKRAEIAQMYIQGLKDTSLLLPPLGEHSCSVWHLFVVRTKARDKLMEYLKQKDIEVGLHYPISLSNSKAYCNKEYVKPTPTPNASAWDKEILSLPMGDHLDKKEVDYIIEAIKDFR